MAKKKAKKAARRPAAKSRKPAPTARKAPARKSSARKSSARKASKKKSVGKPTRKAPKKAAARKAPARANRPAVKRPTATAKAGGVSDAAVTRATGKGWDHWLAVLDAFDVKSRGHAAAAAHLHTAHNLDGWWAQMVTVGYEQKRGLRAPRQKIDGFSASASRTIAAPMTTVLDAFENRVVAERWLPAGVVAHKVARPPFNNGAPTKAGSARMTWTDGSKVLSVWIADKTGKDGSPKTAVQIQHDRLPGEASCESARAMWAERLDALRAMLESIG